MALSPGRLKAPLILRAGRILIKPEDEAARIKAQGLKSNAEGRVQNDELKRRPFILHSAFCLLHCFYPPS
jgi:hypothetical protein